MILSKVPANTPWTEAEINGAIAILRESLSVQDALPTIAEKVRAVGGRGLREAFQRAGVGPPAAHLSDAARARVTGGKALAPGQRLKGVSTLYGEGGQAAGAVDGEWVKTERDSDDPAAFDPVPPSFLVKGVSSFLDAQGQVRGQWVKARPEETARWAAFETAMREAAELYTRPALPVAAPDVVSGEWLNVIPWGDPHIGMLAHGPEAGENWDLKISSREHKAAFDLLVASAPPAEKALLVELGDFFHAEDDRQVTPGHGHKLDVDGRWSKVYRVGLELLVYAIDRLLEKHLAVDVDIRPGNHDPLQSRSLPLYLQAWYRNEPRVKVLDNDDPYYAHEFGRNMIVTCHGDGCKRELVPDLAAATWPELWGRTLYRNAYTGHVHHEWRKDFRGMTVESSRILPGTDAWHRQKGYGAPRSIDLVSHHAEYGPVHRTTFDIRRIRAGVAL